MSKSRKISRSKDLSLLNELRVAVAAESARDDAFAVESTPMEDLDLATGGAAQPDAPIDACSCWCTGSAETNSCPGCGPG
jgi:hypothetical protein